LPNKDNPRHVPAEFIAELKTRKTLPEMRETVRIYAENEVVRIIAGAFASPIAGEQRLATVIASGKNTTRVSMISPTRGEIIATIPTAHLASTVAGP
jgi:hypothetical protein